MKRLLTAAAMAITLSGVAQVVYSGGVGLSLNAESINGFTEAGGRLGSLCYIGGQVAFRESGYPLLSAGVVLGAAHSWNNGKMHELTTILYGKADKPLMMNEGYKANPPVPFGFGIRHYVYNAMFDINWSHSQLQFTIGYSLRDIYR